MPKKAGRCSFSKAAGAHRLAAPFFLLDRGVVWYDLLRVTRAFAAYLLAYDSSLHMLAVRLEPSLCIEPAEKIHHKRDQAGPAGLMAGTQPAPLSP